MADDLDAVLADHRNHGDMCHWRRLAIDADERCLPYRLAERARDAEAKLAAVADEVSEANAMHDRHAAALNGLIGDCIGCLAESVRAALGGDQEQPDPCPHLSYTGVDTYFGPGKVWACDSCGYRKTGDWSPTNAIVDAPASAAVEAYCCEECEAGHA